MIKIAKTIKTFIISFFTAFFTHWLEDFLIFTGLSVAIVNTYLISEVKLNILIGNYFLSFVLIIVGIVLAKR